jgi:hypothetical protein
MTLEARATKEDVSKEKPPKPKLRGLDAFLRFSD